LKSDNCKLQPSGKARNYHAQLQAMLKTLREVQTGEDTRLQNVEIYLFDKQDIVDILCPILFISADTPAADKLCGHFASHTTKVKCIPCSCDTLTNLLDDPTHTCYPVLWDTMHYIAVHGTLEECQAVSNTMCIMPLWILTLVTPTTRFLMLF
jgi:hypothetical protein